MRRWRSKVAQARQIVVSAGTMTAARTMGEEQEEVHRPDQPRPWKATEPAWAW
jgi:hypothetical protein